MLSESLKANVEQAGLQMLTIKGRTLLPVVQGGMGVGISAGGLAGTVAALGAVGTISSVDLRRLHPDLMLETQHIEHCSDARERIDAANLLALDREIRKARSQAQGRGLIAVNVMRALSAYEKYVQQALTSGADAIVVGAGLPLDLPELAAEHPNVALIPILSDARGVQLLLRKWEKKGRLPDALIIEHPRLAGGHLGAAKLDDLRDPRFEFENVVPEVLEICRKNGFGSIPLILAGGMHCQDDIRRMQQLGAQAVQLGTAFAVTKECDAAQAFKEVLARSKPQDVVEFVSVAGLPARAVRTPWVEKYLRILPILQERAHPKARCNMAFDCLQQCGLRDGLSSIGQFCIDQQLGHALNGDFKRGLFFRGAGQLPFGEQIRPVADLMRWLIAATLPSDMQLI